MDSWMGSCVVINTSKKESRGEGLREGCGELAIWQFGIHVSKFREAIKGRGMDE